jgi:hypothetical protein
LLVAAFKGRHLKPSQTNRFLQPTQNPQPANIFLDGSLNAKLGDVGLAAAAKDGALTCARKDGGGEGGAIAGEWAYLAPEYRSDGRLSLKTDVYAWVGVVCLGGGWVVGGGGGGLLSRRVA